MHVENGREHQQQGQAQLYNSYKSPERRDLRVTWRRLIRMIRQASLTQLLAAHSDRNLQSYVMAIELPH